MAHHFDQRGMPAGLSLTGQRVLTEVRNSWMKNNPEYAVARQQIPENQSRPDNSRIPSWNTQIANMPTQDLFNSKHINRQQDFNPAQDREPNQKIDYDIIRAHQQSVHYNLTQRLQQFHQSQDVSQSTQLGIHDDIERNRGCTQKSIMLFEDEDDNVEENSITNVTKTRFYSNNFNNPEDIEEEDMFRSVNEETNSPPIEIETEPNSPAFNFQPVMCDLKENEYNTKAQASDDLMFKVPQAVSATRVQSGVMHQRFNSAYNQWPNESKENVADNVSEPVIYSPTRNYREQEREFSSSGYRLQCDNGRSSSRNSTKSGYASNSAFERQALSLTSSTDSYDDNENGKGFREPALDIEEFPFACRAEFDKISENSKIGDEYCKLPASECLQISPSALNGVDKKFISELMYKLNNLAEINARQEKEQLALTANGNKPTSDFNVETATSDTPITHSEQEKPLPNHYIFKTPLKRSVRDSELNKKAQTLGVPSSGGCENDDRVGNGGETKKSRGNKNMQRKENNLAVEMTVPKKGEICSEDKILKNIESNDSKPNNLEDSLVQKIVITILTEKSMRQIESQLSTCQLDEVALTILYKDGVTQLDAAQGVTLVPTGLLFSLRTADVMQYYFLRDLQIPWMPAPVISNFLSLLFTRPCPKICVDAQAMFMYLVDKFSFTQEQVCDSQWKFVDPLVGGWLLDPDHPPTDFLSLAASLIGKQSCAKGGGRKERACRLLELLSRTAGAVVTKLQEAGLYSVFTELEMKLVPVLAVMELRGIAVDIGKLRQMQAILESRLADVSAQAYRAAGRKFSLNSPVQLRTLLYDELHLDKGLQIKSTAALGAKSTAEPMLLLLAPLHPLPALVLRYRQLHKIKAAYVDGILEHSNDGVIFTSWEQTCCATGRITSNSPNVQTIPRVPISLYPEHEVDKIEGPNTQGFLDLRSVFVPRPGYALVSADFCQVELRLFAHFAQDQTLLRAFQQEGDIFQHLAMLWLGSGEGDEDQAKQREKTKRVVYAVMYGAGALKLSEFLQVSQQQASAIMDSFLGLVPALRRFPQQVVERCRKQGFLRSLSGRLRKFPQISSAQLALRKHAERQAMNFLIQGSAADVCKAAMLATEHHIQENAQLGARLLLQIHDELVWEVPCNNVQCFKELISAVMDDTNGFCGKMGPLSVGLPIAVRTGDTWGDMS